ncbi:MAG: MoaD/ThiS family protein [Chloroflexi bacterium]|nr:MoaD/ThiS family protein [Chloroflexota bacterium]
MQIEVWLYGPLAHYGDGPSGDGYAQLHPELPPGATMRSLLEHLSLPTTEKGITFINGQLSDMPGLLADLDHTLQDGDRVAFFHNKSMWPFQYRDGAALLPELREALQGQESALHHSYTTEATN